MYLFFSPIHAKSNLSAFFLIRILMKFDYSAPSLIGVSLDFIVLSLVIWAPVHWACIPGFVHWLYDCVCLGSQVRMCLAVVLQVHYTVAFSVPPRCSDTLCTLTSSCLRRNWRGKMWEELLIATKSCCDSGQNSDEKSHIHDKEGEETKGDRNFWTYQKAAGNQREKLQQLTEAMSC